MSDRAESRKLFISCVSSEFQNVGGQFHNLRDDLRLYLSRAECVVKTQEEFRKFNVDILEKLDYYIRDCGAVVHLVGVETGSIANEEAVSSFLKREPQFLSKLPKLKAALERFENLSYTQWEALIAIHRDVKLTMYATEQGAIAQKDYLNLLKLGREHAEELSGDQFDSRNQLFGLLIGDLSDIAPTLTTSLDQNEYFETKGVFGRTEEILDLALTLKNESIVVVYGLAGIGKSKIVEQISSTQIHAERGYERILVYPETSVMDLYRQVATRLGDRRENPVPSRSSDNEALLNFSELAQCADADKEILFHIEQAHSLVSGGVFRDPQMERFFDFIARELPAIRIVLESREDLHELLESCNTGVRVRGIGRESLAAWYRKPFPNLPQISWDLDAKSADIVFRRLGGAQNGELAHPLAMQLLATVAAGSDSNSSRSPLEVLEDYPNLLLEKLEEVLFSEIFDSVLTSQERSLLLVLSLYRGATPDQHIEPLGCDSSGAPSLDRLIDRCLVTPDLSYDWYTAHLLVKEMACRRYEHVDECVEDDHEKIALLWLGQLKGVRRVSPPNVAAAAEAAYHILRSGNFRLLEQLEKSLLSLATGDLLKQYSRSLFDGGKHEENRLLLEVLVALEEREAELHRYLGETLERLNPKSYEDALTHYWEAHRLDPSNPVYVSDIGRYLGRNGRAQEFLDLTEQLEPSILEYEYVFTQRISCLEALGKYQQASSERCERIEGRSQISAIYSAEARYQSEQLNNPNEGLRLLDLAASRGVDDDFSISVRASILERMGRGAEASMLRMSEIEKKSRGGALYNAEAKYQAEQLSNPEEGLRLLDLAADRGLASDFDASVYASILEGMGRGNEASELRLTAIDNNSDNSALYISEAKYQAGQMGDSEAGLRLLDLAANRGLENDYAVSVRCSILERMGRGDESSQLRLTAIDNDSDNSALYISEAKYQAEQMGDSEAGLRLLDLAANRGLEDDYAESIRCLILERMGRGDEASQLRLTAIDNDSDNSALYISEAKYQAEQMGDSEAGLRLLDLAANRGLEDDYAESIRCSILERMGRGDEASQLRLTAIDNDSDNSALYISEAKYQAEQIGDSKEGLRLLDLAANRGLENDYAVSVRCSILERMGQGDEASQLRLTAIDNDSDNSALYISEAKYQAEQMGDSEAGLRLLDLATNRGLEDEYADSVRCSILERMGRGDEASQLRLTAIDNDSAKSALYISEAKYQTEQMGDSEAGLRLLDLAANRGLEDDYTVSIRCSILEQMGRGDEASTLRMAAISSHTHNGALYNAEAKYQAEQLANPDEGLLLLDLAADRGVAGDFSTTVRASILEGMGRGKEASTLRMSEIDKISNSRALYNAEAKYQAEQLDNPEEGLRLLSLAADRGIASDFDTSVRASILEGMGRGEEASTLRMSEIDNNSKSSALYNAEAKYQAEELDNPEAGLRLLGLAADRGLADDFQTSIRSSILEGMGRGIEASQLRMAAIGKGSRNTIFYNAEAKYQSIQLKDPAQGLRVLDLAIDRGITNDYLVDTRSSILEGMGREVEASALRMAAISEGSEHLPFYISQANYLVGREEIASASELLLRAILALGLDSRLLAKYLSMHSTPVESGLSGLLDMFSIDQVLQSDSFLVALIEIRKTHDFLSFVVSNFDSVVKNAAVAIELARNLELHDHPEEALRILDALQIETPEVLRIRGNCLKSQGKPLEAKNLFEELQRGINDPREKSFVLNNIAQLIRQERIVDEYSKGIAYSKEAIELNTDHFHYPREHLAFFLLATCSVGETSQVLSELRSRWGVGKNRLHKVLREIGGELKLEVWREDNIRS